MAPSSDMGGDYFLILIFLLPLLYFIFKQFKTSRNIIPLPPGPAPWPLIGNIAHMSNNMPHISLSNLAQIHGPLIMLRLGTQHLVVGSSPAAAKEILITHDRVLSARYAPKSVPFKQEELNRCSMSKSETCNDRWKFLRTICRAELFSVKALDAQSCLREKKIFEMIEYLKGKSGNGVVNIGELAFVTVYNMLSNVFLSRDLIGLNEERTDGGMKHLISTILENATAPNISNFYPILSKFDLQGIRKKSSKLRSKILAIHEPIIEERRKAGTPLTQNDFLDVLLHNNFTNAQVHQFLMELFTAGTDTSTSTIEWAMAELIKSPECMKKVIEELDREVGANLVKESGLGQLSYLQACIKETRRLHPPAPLLLPHRAHESCQVMNYTIPKNAQVLVNIWAIGRDPAVWDEPLKFKPERFLKSAMDLKGNGFEFIPFGAGRRMCPGLPMAERHVPLILATLLNSFDWHLPQGKDPQQLDMKEKFGVTLQMAQPLLLIPKIRKS